jgi:endonuclease I
MQLKPCHDCIKSLREKLFEIKTKCDMQSFDVIKNDVYNELYDLYSGVGNDIITKNKKKYNIEHVVPAHIMAPRIKHWDNDKFSINREPFHDPHILFPSLKIINDIRGNYIYGNLANNREGAIINDKVTGIVNQNNYLETKKLNFKPPSGINVLTNKDQLNENENLDIYISEKAARSKNDCDFGECIFQPSKEFSGDIARIVFYFYLMYAYDFRVRPYTHEEPWLSSFIRGQCKGFNIKLWEKFFLEHIKDYFDWAANDKINDLEHKRNKAIIEITQVPNIFVGFYNKSDVYVNSSENTILEDLLFGKEHDHAYYKNLEFRDLPECPTRQRVYDYDKEKGNCKKTIKEQNETAFKQQEVYYQPLKEVSLKIDPLTEPVAPTPAEASRTEPLTKTPEAPKPAATIPLVEPLTDTPDAPKPASPEPVIAAPEAPKPAPLVEPLIETPTEAPKLSLEPVIAAPEAPKPVPVITTPEAPKPSPVVQPAAPSVETPPEAPTQPNLENLLTPLVGGNMRTKYLKYKRKYLNLKNKR